MAHPLGDGSFKFGFGGTSVGIISEPLTGTADSSYTVQNEILDGSGNVAAILYGGAEYKASVTGYGTSMGSLGSATGFFGLSGSIATTKVSAESSNEDLTKYTVEIYGIN